MDYAVDENFNLLVIIHGMLFHFVVAALSVTYGTMSNEHFLKG